MADNFTDFTNQVKAVFKTMSPAKLITLAILLISTVAGIAILVKWSSQPEYMPLYTQLTAEDAGTVVAKLREQKIPYLLSADGSTVQIPREMIYEKRLELASEGLPRGSGIGFEVFDNTKLVKPSLFKISTISARCRENWAAPSVDWPKWKAPGCTS